MLIKTKVMNKYGRSNKRTRLTSDISNHSGTSAQTNMTQTTELENDFEDNYYPCENQYNNSPRKRSISDILDNDFQFPPTVTSPKAIGPEFRRKRQVSWSLCDDDVDNNQEEEERIVEYKVSQEHVNNPNVFRYDNNLQAINPNPRRNRRFTEGSLDEYQPLCGETKCHCGGSYPPIRSNTTSQLRNFEEEIKRRFIVEKLIREHDERKQRAGHSLIPERRSQSFSSLSNHGTGAFSSPSNVHNTYTSIQNIGERMPTACDTRVNLEPNATSYISPTTESSKARMTEDVHSRATFDSGYAHVQEASRKRQSFFSIDKNRKSTCRFVLGIFVLLNIILIIGNAVVLGIYLQNRHSDTATSIPQLSIADSVKAANNNCISCKNPQGKERTDLENAGFNITDDGRCCLQPETDLLPALAHLSQYLVNKGTREFCASTSCEQSTSRQKPILQLEAEKLGKCYYSEYKDHCIVWKKKPDINNGHSMINETLVTVEHTGYYYVFSRVHYVKRKDDSENHTFSFGHSLKKLEIDSQTPKAIDHIEQRCFPATASEDIRHTSHLGSVQHFIKGQQIFMELNHAKYFDATKTLFGMFLVS